MRWRELKKERVEDRENFREIERHSVILKDWKIFELIFIGTGYPFIKRAIIRLDHTNMKVAIFFD